MARAVPPRSAWSMPQAALLVPCRGIRAGERSEAFVILSIEAAEYCLRVRIKAASVGRFVGEDWPSRNFGVCKREREATI